MKPRPIYRWKSFWLGLCALVFVGWACHFSLTHTSGVLWGPLYANHGGGGARVGYDPLSSRGFRTFHHKEAIQVGMEDVDPMGNPGPRRIVFYSKGDVGSPWVRPMGVAGGGKLTAFLPHWLVLLVMAALWSAWLACHWKREQGKRNA